MVKYYPYDKTPEERIKEKQQHLKVDEELAKRFMSSKSTMHQELPTKYSEQEMEEMRIPHIYRNPCAHLHVKLTECKTDKLGYVRPWRCELEQARLDRCLYKLWLRDVRRSDQLHRAEYKLRLIYEELEKKGADLPFARKRWLRTSEAEHGQFEGAPSQNTL